MGIEGKGILPKKGFYPPQSFYPKVQGPVHLMVYGGISLNGFRTPLIYSESYVNSETYIKVLKENFIFENNESLFVDLY